MKAATFLGEKLFGNRNAYVEYALLNDLRAQGLSVDKIIELARGEQEEAIKTGGDEQSGNTPKTP